MKLYPTYYTNSFFYIYFNILQRMVYRTDSVALHIMTHIITEELGRWGSILKLISFET